MYLNDTIIAQATPSGKGALAVIRLSGPRSKEIAQSIVKESNKFAQSKPKELLVYSCINPATFQFLDQVTAVWYLQNKSFTGEEMVEIICHGGLIPVQKIMGAAIEMGCRLAKKGEFSQRAILHGKMDLLTAEAINEIIAAQNEIAHLQAASYFSKSAIRNEMLVWKEQVLELLTLIETSIEFPEEDDIRENSTRSSKVETLLRLLKKTIEIELSKRKLFCSMEKGILVALIGNKNGGKSSLFNALIEEERAIVHEKEGTTRDSLYEKISVEGIPVTIIDTAGLGEPQEEIEALGIDKSWNLVQQAHLVLLVTASNRAVTQDEIDVLSKRNPQNCVVVISKHDLTDRFEKFSLTNTFNFQYVSVSNKDTVHELRLKIRSIIHEMLIPFQTDQLLFLNERHQRIASAILQEINLCDEIAAHGEEVQIFHLKNIAGMLEEFVGVISSEDVLNSVFDTFCIGK